MFPFTLAIGAALGLSFASAASHYVALGGDDANPGLEGSPWRTLAKACDAVPADQGHTIHIGEGIFTETEILKLKSGVNLIGAGSGKTRILVNHPFSLTDAVSGANPHVHTFPEHFILQMDGGHQVVKGFALDGQDIWGTEIPGKVSHNFFSHMTPSGENAMSGDPGITLAKGVPLRPPYYTFVAGSPVSDKVGIIAPLTDGFTGAAPDPGALENGTPPTTFGAR